MAPRNDKFMAPDDSFVFTRYRGVEGASPFADREAKLARGRDRIARGEKLEDVALDHAIDDFVAEEATRSLSAARDDNEIHSAADDAEGRIARSVRMAFAAGKKAAAGALDNAQSLTEAARAMAPVPNAVRDSLLATLPKALLAGLEHGGKAGIERLPKPRALAKGDPVVKKIGPVTIEFDPTNQNAAEWAAKHATELAKDLSDTSRQDIATALVELFNGEGDLEDVMDAVGDDDRAEVIARTESMRAANEGQRQAWAQAQEKGLLDGSERREWIATSGCCDECDELDGTTAILDGTYAGGVDGPPLHPNCRCTEGISAQEE